MKPRKIKKKRFIRVKTEKDSAKHSCTQSNSLPFAVGDEVLACWQDGLYYLAVVKTVRYIKACVVCVTYDASKFVLCCLNV
jgi:hypothetical protein